jgi:hypothetical protein
MRAKEQPILQRVDLRCSNGVVHVCNPSSTIELNPESGFRQPQKIIDYFPTALAVGVGGKSRARLEKSAAIRRRTKLTTENHNNHPGHNPRPPTISQTALKNQPPLPSRVSGSHTQWSVYHPTTTTPP